MSYNLRNRAVKRLMREAEELKQATEEYYASPLDDNLFEWHFTLRGPPNTEFEGGVYHGRISLPADYPMKPPSIILLTPNGRFETNKKICLSISGHHPETWQPSWSIRTALLALIGFLPTHGNGALGALDYTPDERKSLALKSQTWKCPECGLVKEFLKEPNYSSSKSPDTCNMDPDEPDMVSESSSTFESPSKEDVQTVENEEKNNEISMDSKVIEPSMEREMPICDYVLEGSSRESESVVRQRHAVSQELPSKPVIPSQPRPVSNCCSLVIIWIISAVLAYLIARRWLWYN